MARPQYNDRRDMRRMTRGRARRGGGQSSKICRRQGRRGNKWRLELVVVKEVGSGGGNGGGGGDSVGGGGV
eukprot:11232816-Alexandrium_andersonii.AAC.1